MSAHTDWTGSVWNWTLDRGEVLPVSFTWEVNGSTVTNISSGRLDFFTGTIGSPGIAFANAVTVSVAASTTVSFTLSETNTRAFVVGTEYCYKLELTLATGAVIVVWKGNIEVGTEFST